MFILDSMRPCLNIYREEKVSSFGLWTMSVWFGVWTLANLRSFFLLPNPTLVFALNWRLLVCFAVERIWSLRPSNKRVSLLYLDCVKAAAFSTLAFLVAYAVLAPLPYLLDGVAFYSAKANHLDYDTPNWLKTWCHIQLYHEVECGTSMWSNALSSIDWLKHMKVKRKNEHFPEVDCHCDHDLPHSDRHLLGHLDADYKSTARDGGPRKEGTASAQSQRVRWTGLRSQLLHIGRGQQDALRLALALPLHSISGTLAPAVGIWPEFFVHTCRWYSTI